MGREILAAHPEEAGTDKVVGQPAKTKNPRSGAAGKKGKQANGGGGMFEDDESFDDGVNGKVSFFGHLFANGAADRETDLRGKNRMV